MTTTASGCAATRSASAAATLSRRHHRGVANVGSGGVVLRETGCKTARRGLDVVVVGDELDDLDGRVAASGEVEGDVGGAPGRVGAVGGNNQMLHHGTSVFIVGERR